MITDAKMMDGWLETEAETRFSDFTQGGVLHFSKDLMYFEKARFAVAEISGIREALEKLLPDARIAFVVIRVRLTRNSRVCLEPGRYDRRLTIRTMLKPSALCRLSFLQQLTDAENGELLTDGQVDVAILVNGEVMRRFPPEIRDCLEAYYRKAGVNTGKR